MHLVRSHFDTFLHRKLMLVFRQTIQVKGAGMEYTCVMCENDKKSFFSTTHFFKAHRHLVFDHFAKAIDTKDIVPNKEDPVVFHTLITPSSPSSRSESGGEDSRLESDQIQLVLSSKSSQIILNLVSLTSAVPIRESTNRNGKPLRIPTKEKTKKLKKSRRTKLLSTRIFKLKSRN